MFLLVHACMARCFAYMVLQQAIAFKEQRFRKKWVWHCYINFIEVAMYIQLCIASQLSRLTSPLLDSYFKISIMKGGHLHVSIRILTTISSYEKIWQVKLWQIYCPQPNSPTCPPTKVFLHMVHIIIIASYTSYIIAICT